MKCRKNVKHLTPDERRRFVAAVVALRDATKHPSITLPGLQSRYDDFAQMRALAATAQQNAPFVPCDANSPPKVFPWHRELVNRFERELQAIDPSVTVPYWDGGGEQIEDPGWPAGMAPRTSLPGDLMFWLSHANVDRLWSIWQMRRPQPWKTGIGTAVGTDDRSLSANRVWYDTDIPEVTLETPVVNFGDVPTGLTTYRAARFHIKGCRETRLRVTVTTPTSAFGLPMGTEFFVKPNETADQAVGFVWVSFSATDVTPPARISVQPYIVDTDAEYTGIAGCECPVGAPIAVNLSANTVPRIDTSTKLVIHRSAGR